MNLLFSNDRQGQYPESWYAATTAFLPPFAPLQGAVTADVCIVGGGYTGLSAALELARAGRRVVLLEAHREEKPDKPRVFTLRAATDELVSRWVESLDRSRRLVKEVGLSKDALLAAAAETVGHAFAAFVKPVAHRSLAVMTTMMLLNALSRMIIMMIFHTQIQPRIWWRMLPFLAIFCRIPATRRTSFRRILAMNGDLPIFGIILK